MTSGYQAQTIFTDSITSIVFTNAPLDQAAGACGLITLAVTKTGSTYGTIDFSDGILGSGNGTFYSDSGLHRCHHVHSRGFNRQLLLPKQHRGHRYGQPWEHP